MNRIYKFLLALLAMNAIPAISDDFVYNRFQYGLWGNYIMIDQKADFRNLPGYPTCAPFFNEGDGNGLSLGLLAEYPLTASLFLGTRLGYEQYSTKMETEEFFPFQNGNNVANGKILHQLETKFHNVTGEAMLGWRPLGGLILTAGIQVGLPFSPKFSQREVLVEPVEYGTFENGTRERNVYNDRKLPSVVKPITLAKVALSYEFPLNSDATLRFAPEVSYNYALTPIIDGYDWHDNSIRAGAALKFSHDEVKPLLVDIFGEAEVAVNSFESCDTAFSTLPQELIFIPQVDATAGVKNWKFSFMRGSNIYEQSGEEIPDRIVLPTADLMSDEIDSLNGEFAYLLSVTDNKEKTVVAEHKVDFKSNNFSLHSSIDGYGIDVTSGGAQYKKTNIQLLRRISSDVRPLLNYVFFETNKSSVPARYKTLKRDETYSFEEAGLSGEDALQTYRSLLNILGKRMREHPETTITLNGYVSNLAGELGNLELARARAESIQKYLAEAWRIDPSRVTIGQNVRPSGLPVLQSFPGIEKHDIESAEENQRVEVIPDAKSQFLLDPVVTKDTSNQVFPMRFVFKPEVKTSGQQYEWQLKISQNDKFFARYNGDSKLPDSLELQLKDREAEMIDKGGNLVYDFTVQDEFGLSCHNIGEINVELMKIDSSINKFNLILFDYESAEIGQRNKQIVEMINKAVTSNAMVSIIGYTDQLGEAGTNRVLSKRRALMTAKEIFADENLAPDDALPINDAEITAVLGKKYYQQLPRNKEITDVKLTAYGVGEDALLYDNSTPEGRFYCRTVTIEVINSQQY